MQIVIKGRHAEVSTELREYITAKASKLLRFYDRIQSIDVVVDHERGRLNTEIIVALEHHSKLVSKESHADEHASVDLAADHMEQQLKRHKERLRNRKHPDSESHVSESGR